VRPSHTSLGREAVLDGEIVVLDSEGRPQFYEAAPPPWTLASRCSTSSDLLWLDGQDLRARPLIEHKRLLRTIIPDQPSILLYARHIERNGLEFFRLTCEQDLEGIVAKLKLGRHGEGWFKIRNPIIRNAREGGSCSRRGGR
jgi:bifunctional non-homologous end joining protein LigD